MTEKKDMVEEAIEKAKPIIAKLSFGALMGYCSGVALKKVGKALAIVVGLGFIALQTASSTGYIAVDWTKILDDVKAKADTNADGSINTDDLKVYWRKFKALMTNKIPSAGGFSLGFLYGVKSG